MFTTKNNHLVAAPFEYDGEAVSETGYLSADVIGTYEVILQKQSIDCSNLEYCSGQTVNLNADGTISGAYTGNWTMEAGSPYVTLTICGMTYEGLFVPQTIEGTNVKTMAFSVFGTNDVTMWGEKYPSPEAAIAMTKETISIPSNVYTDITLPTIGLFGANVSWSSSHPSIITNSGKVTLPADYTNVTLTAIISRDGKTYSKDYTVTVNKAVTDYNEIQLIASAFLNDPQDLSKKLDGSLSMPNPYVSISNLDLTRGVKIKFDVEPTGINKALSTIISFMGNDGGNGRLYFTPGSYLGYNATGGFFDANMRNWGAVTDYIGNSKATIELSFSDAGLQVDVNGVKAYDQTILNNSSTGGKSLTDYYDMLYWLTRTADKVYFGKGSWWSAAGFDEALCKIRIASAFVNNPIDLSTKLDGKLTMANPFRSISNLDVSKGVKIKFDVQSTGTNRILATILSFMGNDGSNGRLYLTPGSYLGYNATGGWFGANMSNFAMVKDYIGTSKSTVELFFTPTGFQVDVNGVKAYDKSILSDPSTGGGTVTDYYNVLYWLTTTADKVYFGKGSWWSAATYDEALCKISNVYFYGYLTPPEDTTPHTYVENYNSAADVGSYWTSTNLQGGLTLKDKRDEHGKYIQFAVTSVSGLRGAVSTFPSSVNLAGKYIVQTDVNLLAENAAGYETQFAITGADMAYNTAGNMNTGVKSGYIVKLSTTGNSTTYTINGGQGTVVIPKSTWIKIKAFVNTKEGTAAIEITNKATGAVLYSGTVTISGLGILKGLYTVAGRTKSVTQVDNITADKYITDLSTLDVALGAASYIYDGTAKTPAVTVKDGTFTLAEGIDYTVTYADNTNAGTATATITGLGDYTGTIAKIFVILKDLSTLTATLSETAFTYDGTAKTPNVTVQDGDTTLTEGTDYILEYTDNINVGTATVTITGTGNYTGKIIKAFEISAKSITSLKASLAASVYAYDGTAKEPAVIVLDGTKTLVNGIDFTVTYENNIKLGSAVV